MMWYAIKTLALMIWDGIVAAISRRGGDSDLAEFCRREYNDAIKDGDADEVERWRLRWLKHQEYRQDKRRGVR